MAFGLDLIVSILCGSKAWERYHGICSMYSGWRVVIAGVSADKDNMLQ